jgi:hypothetical protein
MPVICPTAQAFFAATPTQAGMEPTAGAEGATKFGRRFKESRAQEMPNSKSPRPVSPARAKSFDAEHMQVICPTCQIFSNSVGRDARRVERRLRKPKWNSQRATALMLQESGEAQTQRGFGKAATQTVNFLIAG